MTFSVDKYLVKSFSYSTYNCFDFARDAWKELTGVDLGSQTPGCPGVDSYHKQAEIVATTLNQLPTPEDPCLILMQRSKIEPHIGVFYNGRVLHLNKAGAYYMPLEQTIVGYTAVSYYK